jgi:PAS domain S-box-containing protein
MRQRALREAAEAQLAAVPARLTQPSADRLLHELQVHQVELEIQNEALRQAQTELETSCNRYRDLYEFAPVAYLTLTGEGRIAEINLTGAVLLGMERQRLLQRQFSQFVSLADRDNWRTHFPNMIRGVQCMQIELSLQRKDGSEFRARLDGLAITAAGGVPAVRIVVSDISELKRHEEERLDSEERFRVIFELSEDAIFVTRPEGDRILIANPAACRMFRYSPEQMSTLARIALMDVTDAAWAALLAERLHHGSARAAVRCLRSNGEVFPVDASLMSFLDSKGLPRGAFLMRDISVQRRAEKQLHESEMRWQFALESHGDAMWDWDAEKDELFLTAAARELFNLAETRSPRPIADLAAQVVAEDRAGLQAQIDDMLAGRTSEWLGEYRVSRPGAAPRWIATRGRIMTRGAAGQPHRIVSISRDFTESKRQETEARRQRELFAHQARLVLLGEMASVLAHEINQPLTAIAGLAAGCARKVANLPEAVELLHAIEEQAMRGGEIAWRMRGFARRQRLGHSALALHEIVGDVANWAGLDSAYPDVVIDVAAVGRDLPLVDADRVELQQVLFNLIRNGIEAGLPTVHGQQVVVAAAVAEAPGEIEITVTDWGRGLPQDADFDAFEPFNSTKEHGVGLGLTICFSIVEEHGGRLWATPNFPGGTIFHFTLPIAAHAAPEPAADERTSQIPLDFQD